MLVSIADQNGRNKSIPCDEMEAYAYQRRTPYWESAMNANETASRLPISEPLSERIVNEVFAALRSAELAITGLWRRNEGPVVDPHAFDAIEHLNERTLNDIGAPHWLVARAAERREAQRLRWIELDVR